MITVGRTGITFLLAVAALAVLRSRRRVEVDDTSRRRRHDRTLGLLAIVSLAVYLGAGLLPLTDKLNQHEWVHYYLGSKYSSELSYDRLYVCIDAADVQDGLGTAVATRTITDLQTNHLVEAASSIGHPEQCTQHFSPSRWSAFRHDVRYFRMRTPTAEWEATLTDHGYNATPVWTATATLLTNISAANGTQVRLLSLFDPLLLLAMLLVIGWAFGWGTLAIAVLTLTTFAPASSLWTAGAFLRWDWLFLTVAAVCCLKKERPLLAGMALGYATILRVFPGVLFCGPLFVIAWGVLRRRALDRTYARLLAGGALLAGLALPASIVVLGGTGPFHDFAANLAKTATTPFANGVGLRTVLAWRSHQGVGSLYQAHAADPLAVWRAARHSAASTTVLPRIVIAAAFVALLARAGRRVEPWVLTALGVALLPVVVDLMSYYYMIIVVLALVAHEREAVGRRLLALCVFSQFVILAPLPGMPAWDDQQFVLISLATVVTFGLILWQHRGKSESVAGDLAVVAAGSDREPVLRLA